LNWYIRPLFIIPFCYFAYKKSVRGIIVTVLAALSSMFWFPAPSIENAQASEFLSMERRYITGTWTNLMIAFAALIPVWFALLFLCFRKRWWLLGVLAINGGAILKIAWGFVIAGDSAWSIVPPVVVGAIVVNACVLFAFRRWHGDRRSSADAM
jgi:hypothetical protein